MARFIITPKDVEIILTYSPGYARTIVRKIKRKNNKEKHQKITVKEFCLDQGLEVSDVIAQLNEFYGRK
ncbi:hypothetical protein [Flavobacterium psychraquaticum]|uniref:hypothetical protein n=1 Tax=Flavobacterium psychraquaticum TaxID=3103958 RepID=UPI002ACE0177|nr:hypothetical protein [Flavobacterium sp. LB-N7T]